MPSNIMSKAETEKTRMELILEVVQRSIREKAQLVSTIRDVSEFAEEGLDTISFPKRVGKFNVQNLAEDEDAEHQTYEFDLDKLDLNHHAMIAWFIKKRASAQSRVNLEVDAIMEASGEHAIDVDRNIISAMVAGADSNNNVSVAGVISKAKILEMKANLQKATRLRSTPNTPIWGLVSSKRESELLNIEGFVEADKYGSSTPLIEGELGKTYGIRWLISDEDELGDDQALFYFGQGLAYGLQLAPDYRQLYIPKKAGTEHALDQLYGLKVLDSGKYIGKMSFTPAAE